ncbi:MAG: hypothetical protein J6L86_05260 [Alphaproteobacteria bacterium]|nr:hypothetical protein [Alphaproteobacteria bacterium]MBQ8630937.1 hypothetical protein [Alphaproteobacteria bacterium]
MNNATEFNYDEAVKNGSLTTCYQYKLGEVYQRKIKMFQNPVIANGPYGARLVKLKIRTAPFQLTAGKTYNLNFRVTFLLEFSVEIDVLSAVEIKD